MDFRSINTDRQFKDATSFSKDEFKKLLSDFEKTFFIEYGYTYEEYIEENVTELPKLKTLGDCLFFVLFQKKNGLIWGSLGVVFGMSGSAAHKNFYTFADILELTLEKKSDAKKVF